MSLVDLIFPKTCLNCGREPGYIGASCLNLVRRAKPICPYCERPSTDRMTHVKCARRDGLDGLTSIWLYEGVIRKAILALKYKYATEIVKELVKVCTPILNGQCQMTNVTLAPIPLHWYRHNYRGFNQSEEIGKEIAKEMGWKFAPDLLIRKKLTTPQTELKAKDRVRNIHGVFSLNTNYKVQDPSKTIVLLDDVSTTGSTLKEAAKVLRRAMTKPARSATPSVAGGKVWGLTIAR